MIKFGMRPRNLPDSLITKYFILMRGMCASMFTTIYDSTWMTLFHKGLRGEASDKCYIKKILFDISYIQLCKFPVYIGADESVIKT